MFSRVSTKAAILFCLSITAPLSFAGQYSDAAKSCISHSTTGKDRIDLAKWIFAIMSTHPEVRQMSIISTAESNGLNKNAGMVFNRLLLTDCKSEFAVLIKEEGPTAFSEAFSTFGELAMEELMQNPSVKNSFEAFTKHLDMKKISKSLDY